MRQVAGRAGRAEAPGHRACFADVSNLTHPGDPRYLVGDEEGFLESPKHRRATFTAGVPPLYGRIGSGDYPEAGRRMLAVAVRLPGNQLARQDRAPLRDPSRGRRFYGPAPRLRSQRVRGIIAPPKTTGVRPARSNSREDRPLCKRALYQKNGSARLR